MKIILPLIATLLWTMPAARADDAFVGAWKIRDAKTLEGQPFTGQVEIKSSGALYEVRWDTTAGKYSGIALAAGKHLTVGWGSKGSGVVLYQKGTDGTLNGRWTAPGAGGEGTEKATGGKPGEFAGEYSLTGTNPGGQGKYQGKLSIQKAGNVYKLTWAVEGSPTYTGVGIATGDMLEVGWSTDTAIYGVIGYTFDGAKAKGIWSVRDAKDTAQENLEK